MGNSENDDISPYLKALRLKYRQDDETSEPGDRRQGPRRDTFSGERVGGRRASDNVRVIGNTEHAFVTLNGYMYTAACLAELLHVLEARAVKNDR